MLQDFREQNPEYNDMSDQQLADALYNKFYSDLPKNEFIAKLNMTTKQVKERTAFDTAADIGSAALSGMTFGLGDEIIAGLSALSPNVTYEQALEFERQKQKQFKEDKPYTAFASEIVGAIPMGIAGGAKLAGTKIGGLAAQNPYTAAAITGGVSGSAYGFGTGEGGTQERLENIPFSAGMGTVGGVGGAAVARGVGSLLTRKPVKEALEQTAQQADELTSLSGSRMSELPSVNVLAQQGKSITMPKGAATGDVNLMRLEEAARQGQFGDDIQRQIQTVDTNTRQDVLNRLQALVGREGTDSQGMLETGLQGIQNRYKASRQLQNKLMTARNDALAKTTVYKDYAKETLGSQLKDLRNTPDFKVALMRESNVPLKKDMQVLDKILNAKSNTGVNFNFLNAWRSGLNDYKPGTQEGVLAGQIKRAYDDWLDNITVDAIKSGDEDIAQKIFDANKSYSKYKSLYGTNRYKGQNTAIEKVLTQEELTPVQAVNTIFGKNIQGNANTAQNLKRLLEGVKGTSREQGIKNNFRGGLILRAYEDATKRGDLSLAQLRNNLIKMKRSEAYKINLAEPDFDTVIDNLVTDLGKVIDAQSRRDVYSPSAPAMIRYLSNTFDKIGYALPTARAGAEGLEQVGRAASQRPQKRALEKSLQEVLDSAKQAMDADRGIYGSISGGVVGGMAAQPFLTDAYENEYYVEAK